MAQVSDDVFVVETLQKLKDEALNRVHSSDAIKIQSTGTLEDATSYSKLIQGIDEIVLYSSMFNAFVRRELAAIRLRAWVQLEYIEVDYAIRTYNG